MGRIERLCARFDIAPDDILTGNLKLIQNANIAGAFRMSAELRPMFDAPRRDAVVINLFKRELNRLVIASANRWTLRRNVFPKLTQMGTKIDSAATANGVKGSQTSEVECNMNEGNLKINIGVTN